MMRGGLLRCVALAAVIGRGAAIPGFAQDKLEEMDRAALADFIRAHGQNASAHTDERHAVDVDGCDLIT